MVKSIYKFFSSRFQNVFLDYKVDFKPRNGHGNGGPHPRLNKIVDGEREAYKTLLAQFVDFKDVFHSIKRRGKNRMKTILLGIIQCFPVWILFLFTVYCV